MESIRSSLVGGVSLICALCARTGFALPAWTNVAGNVIVGDVISCDATSVTLVTGATTQRVARTVFPATELARMAADATYPPKSEALRAERSEGIAEGRERVPPVADATERVPPVADATERVPPVLAPVWREFEAKCAAKTVTRGDLIVFKRFVAASALDDAAKKTWTRKARERYQEVKGAKGRRDKGS